MQIFLNWLDWLIIERFWDFVDVIRWIIQIIFGIPRD